MNLVAPTPIREGRSWTVTIEEALEPGLGDSEAVRRFRQAGEPS